MERQSFLLIFTFCFFSLFSNAQVSDSLNIEIGTTATFASQAFQPQWIVSNRFGTIADIKTDASTHLKITNRRSFYKTEAFTDSIINNRLYVDLGLDVYNNEHFKKVFIKEGYVKVGYGNWQLRAGRFEEITGGIDKDLSTGSWGISGNALPIPKVGIIVTDYTNVPLTKGWLKFKGQLSHGWWGNNRFMKDAFYHEKLFYMQVGKKKLKLYGGVQHFAEWAGRRGDVKLEKSWKGFFDILTVKRADDGSFGGTDVRYANRPGDQRGLLEAGFTWDNDKILLKGYNQTMFETGRDIDTRNIDRLLGGSITFKSKKTGIQRILGEFIHTKQMLDFVEPEDRQSYYNNGYYRTGWEYEDRIVGTPLFYNNIRAGKFLKDYGRIDWNAPDSLVPSNSNIINSRIVGFHVGALYNFSNLFAGKTVITYTKNFGTHTVNLFTPGKKQYYTLQELSYNLNTGLQITAGLGLDFGDLYKNFGALLRVQWNFENILNRFD